MHTGQAVKVDVLRADELKEFLDRVCCDFSQFRFKEGRKFAFRYPKNLYYEKLPINNLKKDGDAGFNNVNDGSLIEVENELEHEIYQWRLLHELGHGLLEHKNYVLDLERIKMERAAWEKAKEVGRRYQIEIDKEFIERELDTYRDWLHRRSKCPICGLTRYQTEDGSYHCPGHEIGTDREFCRIY